MQWLNYHHLLYFWTVARLGSIARASEELSLAQPTISGQIRTLETSLGEQLFQRVGRNLVLTEVGQVVYRYADEIFTLGRELAETLRGQPSGRPLRVQVGIADVVPKLIAHRLLAPLFELDQPVQLTCREDKVDKLLADLATNALDVVLSDQPLGPSARIKAYDHLLGESGITFMAAPAVAARHRRRFPASLDGAPMLLPSVGTSLRVELERWFAEVGVRPRVVAELDDNALLEVFGQSGAGIMPVASTIAAATQERYRVRSVGEAPEIVERFFAITTERRIKNPAVAAISAAARRGGPRAGDR